MAGRLGTVYGLIFGLVVVVAGSAALPPATNAESAGNRIAQGGPSVFAAPAQPNPQAQPARAGSPGQEAPTPEQVKAIAHVQTCLAELGYYKGPVDGKRGRETWTAYWNFKHDHGLGGYSDLLAEPVRQKLDELCIETAAIEPSPGQRAETAATDVAPQPESSNEQDVAEDEGPRLDLDCLPDELIALLRRAHGAVAVNRCAPSCLPSPRGLNQSQLDELQAKNGVAWCRACVPIDGHLALDDVRRIERAGNLQLCATPPLQLQRYGSGAGDPLRSYTRIRELYRALPPAEEDPDAFAVIIGNRNYAMLPASETSQNDASAIYAFLSEHLGYRPDNIIDVRDAKKADLEKLFGAEPALDGELARLVESQPNAKVLVYYSGHGATDAAQTESYLLPVDVESYREEIGGYKISTLYANLARLNAKSVLVLLETDYGRDHGPLVLPPNLPETLNTVLPRAPLPSLTVLAASDRGQRTLTDVTYDIGLFTRYLIEGLAGNADLPPIGNGDGELDSAEIYAFTAAYVDLAARKTFGMLQHPVYSSAATSGLATARAVPEAPQ
ncbi:MAG TPA: caspase family protein [Xanthobacteraceae bacterium]